MLFGPIYLTLIVKIVLTILAVIKHKEKDTAEQNRGVLLAFTAILMLANLSNAQTMADLSSGLIESRSIASYTIDREPLRAAQKVSFALPREAIYCSHRVHTSAARVSLSPPREMALRIASSKSLLSRNAMMAWGTVSWQVTLKQ